ncbi:TRAP transporter small permease [Halomonas sp. ATBC28]|uniref:TRAP transporter small permease n=1 Tax=Halomonas sp. ATBC28 TaxID=2545264 RepID=UPI00110D43B5|nr:TRAP transporter small permease [Halomonas sp. ATBC28]TMU20219.1 TRAP transporter small permease [Halomonas sp. ATBC28]
MKFMLREAEKIFCAVLFMGMTLLGFANVVVRYGTNYSLAATEELLTNGFLILTIFGAAIAARRGEHLAVSLFYDLLPASLRKIVFLLSGLFSVALLALSAYFSWEVLMNQLSSGMRSYGLGLPAWYYHVAIPFGFALIIVRYLQRLRDEQRNRDSECVGGANV